jgi:hypothetical protein
VSPEQLAAIRVWAARLREESSAAEARAAARGMLMLADIQYDREPPYDAGALEKADTARWRNPRPRHRASPSGGNT